MMSYRVTVAMLTGASALVLATGTVQGGGVARPATAAAVPASARTQEPGKAIFEGKGNCAICHGRDARGTPLGPDLTDGQWLQIPGTLESVESVIRAGVAKPKKFPGPMPPLGGARLRDAEVAAVARYVFSLNPTTEP
jgi:mono/diheme cytochrome c family protein